VIRRSLLSIANGGGGGGLQRRGLYSRGRAAWRAALGRRGVLCFGRDDLEGELGHVAAQVRDASGVRSELSVARRGGSTCSLGGAQDIG
jgi:hypothetical protein